MFGDMASKSTEYELQMAGEDRAEYTQRDKEGMEGKKSIPRNEIITPESIQFTGNIYILFTCGKSPRKRYPPISQGGATFKTVLMVGYIRADTHFP